LLKHEPPESLTIMQVAKAAGVARPLVRYYFGDLQGLLRAVNDTLMTDLQNRMQASLEESGSLFNKIRRRLELRLEFMQEHPNFERLASREVFSSQVPGERRLERTVERGMALTRGVFEGLPLSDADFLHIHVTIVGLSAFMETGKPLIEMLFGSGARGRRGTALYLDFVARLLAEYVQKKVIPPRS
jgi:AcrR family transcriptional regulator